MKYEICMRILGCGVIAVLLIGCGDVPQLSASQDADAIMALELELTNLLERGALDDYARHLTADYALTTSQGEFISREQALASWRTRGPGYKMTPSEMHVRVYGNSAILTARVVGPNGGPGDRITKTFVRINGEWMLAALHSSQVAEPGQ